LIGRPAAYGDGVLSVSLARRFGGADVRVTETARALAAHVPVTVVCLAGSPLHDRLREAGIDHRALTVGRGDPRAGHAVATLLRTGRYRVVDAHNPQSQWWSLLAARAVGTPVLVMTAHSQYRYEHGPASVRGRAYEAVLRAGRVAGARFVAVSEATADYLRQIGVPPGRVRVIPNAVAASPAVEPDRAALPAGWPADALVLGTAARLEPVKGVADLLEALAAVRADGLDARLLVVGDGRARADLDAAVARLGLGGAVAFTGFRPDVARLLPLMDVFCMASHSEGLPFALLEAAAARRPALVTGVGEMPRVVAHGGTGWVARPREPASLAEGIRWMAADAGRRAAAGEALRADVLARYGPEPLARATLAAYGMGRPGLSPPGPA
jgi:glycosyltransferase involved in cell wall biosynthesis